MSKTPLKQADQTLVQGAYRAAAAGIGQDGMGQAMDSIAGSMQKFVDAQVERKKELRKVGDDLAKQIEANGGSLDQSWMTACRPQVEKLHGSYDRGAAWGKKKQMITLTLQGNLTEKQFEKIEKALLKIAVRYKLGYGALDEMGLLEG